MPVYNAEPYLGDAVRSVLNQSLPDLELLAVDDGSTDGSAGILRAFADADPRVRVLTQPNAGCTAALVRGLSEARAPLVARMDADDRCHPERLARQADWLDRHPEVLLLGTGWTLEFPDGRVVPGGVGHADAWAAGPDAIARRLAQGHNCLAHPSVMFRRDAFAAAGGYDPAWGVAQDFECWLRLSRTHRLACLPDPLMRLRVHPASTGSRRGAAQIAAVERALRKHWVAAGRPPRAERAATFHLLADRYLAGGDRPAALRSAARALALRPASLKRWAAAARLAARGLRSR